MVARVFTSVLAFGLVVGATACGSGSSHAAACREGGVTGGAVARVTVCVGGRQIDIPALRFTSCRLQRNSSTCSSTKRTTCTELPAVRLQSRANAIVGVSGVQARRVDLSYGAFQVPTPLPRFGGGWRLPSIGALRTENLRELEKAERFIQEAVRHHAERNQAARQVDLEQLREIRSWIARAEAGRDDPALAMLTVRWPHFGLGQYAACFT